MVDESRQCTATAKSTGERCQRAAIKGGNVCHVHGVLVRPCVSPSAGKYHTRRCMNVGDNHIERSREWARRSRVKECSVCKGTADTPAGCTFTSPAHELRKQGGAHD